MTTSLHDTGEEAILDDFFEESLSKPASLSVGLFNDGSDSLTESSTYSDITTEPTGGSYAQQSVSFGTADITNSDNSGDWESLFKDLTFDTSDSSQSVDSYYVTITFTSDDKSDGSATEHLLFTASLDQTYDLSSVDTFTLKDAGVSIS